MSTIVITVDDFFYLGVKVYHPEDDVTFIYKGPCRFLLIKDKTYDHKTYLEGKITNHIKHTIFFLENFEDACTILGSKCSTLSVTENKPWGNYTNYIETEKFKVKEIIVDPFSRLSLQRHFHRCEYHFVLSGNGYLQKGFDLDNLEDHFLVPGKTVYIDIKEYHRICNTTSETLKIIELQTGDKVIEEDIERVSDDYNRT